MQWRLWSNKARVINYVSHVRGSTSRATHPRTMPWQSSQKWPNEPAHPADGQVSGSSHSDDPPGQQLAMTSATRAGNASAVQVSPTRCIPRRPAGDKEP